MEAAHCTRVIGSMVEHLNNKQVSVVGRIIRTGNEKSLITTDKKSLKIFNSIEVEVGKVVEVVGICARSGIRVTEFTVLGEDMYNEFDEGLYNKAIELTGKCYSDYIQNDGE